MIRVELTEDERADLVEVAQSWLIGEDDTAAPFLRSALLKLMVPEEETVLLTSTDGVLGHRWKKHHRAV